MKYIILSLILLGSLAINGQGLLFKVSNPQVSGSNVTYDVSVVNFKDIVTMHYVINYDPGILTFVKLKSIMPVFSIFDFDTTTPGSISDSWFDGTENGLTLADNTIIYRIEFHMINGTYGTVCFSTDPSDILITQGDTLISSLYVVDDCHSDPYEVNLITSLQDANLENHLIDIQQITISHKINFILKSEEALLFQMFDLNGKSVAFFSRAYYSPGENSLAVPVSVIPGVYILTTEIENRLVTCKIIMQ